MRHAGVGDRVGIGAGVAALAPAQKDPGPALAQFLAPVACPIEQFLGQLESDSVLRVHAGGFRLTDAEIAGVEILDSAYEAAPLGVALAGGRLVQAKVLLDREAFRGNFADETLSSVQILPELFRAIRPGKAASHRDDRDRLPRGGGLGFRTQALAFAARATRRLDGGG